MSQTTLEERITALEQKVADLMGKVLSAPVDKDWRSTIGMFADNLQMKEIDEEGRKIREADREKTSRDST